MEKIVEIKNKWDWGYDIHLIHSNCGTLTIKFKDGTTWGTIYGLVVHPNNQKQGIGTELMKRAEEIIKEEGYDLIGMSTGKEYDWLIEWFQHLGYEFQYEDINNYYFRKEILNNS